jgi:hypothetical protein
MALRLYFPSERKSYYGFVSSLKIHRPGPCLNQRNLDAMVSTLTTRLLRVTLRNVELSLYTYMPYHQRRSNSVICRENLKSCGSIVPPYTALLEVRPQNVEEQQDGCLLRCCTVAMVAYQMMKAANSSAAGASIYQTTRCSIPASLHSSS